MINGKCRWCNKEGLIYADEDLCPECFRKQDDMEYEMEFGPESAAIRSELEYEEAMERRIEEMGERAGLCKCGAYQFNPKTGPYKVADCYCGAD